MSTQDTKRLCATEPASRQYTCGRHRRAFGKRGDGRSSAEVVDCALSRVHTIGICFRSNLIFLAQENKCTYLRNIYDFSNLSSVPLKSAAFLSSPACILSIALDTIGGKLEIAAPVLIGVGVSKKSVCSVRQHRFSAWPSAWFPSNTSLVFRSSPQLNSGCPITYCARLAC